jgi:intein/homing endonuclease
MLPNLKWHNIEIYTCTTKYGMRKLILKNVTIKFNEILSMDDISYEILSHGHYFIEDNIL